MLLSLVDRADVYEQKNNKNVQMVTAVLAATKQDLKNTDELVFLSEKVDGEGRK